MHSIVKTKDTANQSLALACFEKPISNSGCTKVVRVTESQKMKTSQQQPYTELRQTKNYCK